VGRLAGGIAHDFNNLLTVIQAHAEFAIAEQTSAEARSDLEEIRHAAESAGRLTRQLLTFSRKQVLEPTTIDLNHAVDDMLGMIARLIGDDIEVVNVPGPALLPVCADAGHLEQVLLNLSVNARDAMPYGGVLRIETANVAIGEGYQGTSGSAIPPGEYVMLAVGDTGVGMSDDVRAHIFEPFFTTKQPGEGTGLGLSTVYGIVRQSGGHIWVYSEPGRGTTFKIFFPPDESQRLQPVRAPRTSIETKLTAKVLVVEDQESVRQAVVRVLRGASLTVLEARDAASALAVVEQTPDLDLVITDMVMPGRSGAELVDDLVTRRPSMPVVVMSGYSEGVAGRQWRMPANATFVEKPVSPKALIAVVRRLLSRDRVAQLG
jgi:CheY-like chemotaxis protein